MDFVGLRLRDEPAPHRYGLPGLQSELVGERLMRSASPLHDLLKIDHAPTVKMFTRDVNKNTERVNGERKINYMASKRKQPSAFAIRRGGLIRRARELRRMKQDELALLLGMKREGVSMLESGKIKELTEARYRLLRDKLGLNPSELTEDAQMLGEDFLPQSSFEARRVGRAWDKLPAPLREYLLAQIEAYQALIERQPILAKAVTDTLETKNRAKREA